MITMPSIDGSTCRIHQPAFTGGLSWLRFNLALSNASRGDRACGLCPEWPGRSRFVPKHASDLDRIKAKLRPPTYLVACPVKFAMVKPTEWDRELVTDLATEGWELRKAQMMRVAWV